MKKASASVIVVIFLIFMFINNACADNTTCSVGVSLRIPLVPGLNAPLPTSNEIESAEQTAPRSEPAQNTIKQEQESDSSQYVSQADNLENRICYTIYSR